MQCTGACVGERERVTEKEKEHTCDCVRLQARAPACQRNRPNRRPGSMTNQSGRSACVYLCERVHACACACASEHLGVYVCTCEHTCVRVRELPTSTVRIILSTLGRCYRSARSAKKCTESVRNRRAPSAVKRANDVDTHPVIECIRKNVHENLRAFHQRRRNTLRNRTLMKKNDLPTCARRVKQIQSATVRTTFDRPYVPRRTSQRVRVQQPLFI